MEKKKILLLIDANSLIHRAWHALPPLSTQKGEAVQAVYGFLSILLKAIKEFEPTHIAAAFDVAGPTLRSEKFASYKATREKAPDELYGQIPLVKEVLRGFGIPLYEKQGFEADDIIGTIVQKGARDKDRETIIVSGDLDTLQLVGKNTRVYTMRKGVQDSVLYDEEAVRARFGGLSPAQLRDYKGLRGDPSDNIPGVSGVGEKTAIQLLGEFGSLEALYAALKKNAAASVKPALKEKLMAGQEQAFFSRGLATMERQAPISFRMEDASWVPPGPEEARALLSRFEFESLLKRMPGAQSSMFQDKNAPGRQEALEERIERLYRDKVFSREVYELEKRLAPIIEAMEHRGVQIDVPYFRSLAKEMEQGAAKLREKIFKHAKQEFNVNSTQQLSRILFEPAPEGFGLSPKGLKKTPKGVISTASLELEKLVGAHPVVESVLRYRELQKLVSTYAKPLPQLADQQGRLHTHFDQLGTATGRISSADPNVQNIPNQGEWGARIRRGFIAAQGFQFVSFDYSQMELRIAAHLSGDERMREFFQQGADIHRMTAATVFGVSEDEVSGEMRFRAKALNFGVLYGMGAQGFTRSAGIPQEEARDFIDQYFVRFPKIHEYIEKTKAFARTHGYVETEMGRRRYLPEVHSRTPQLRAAAERMAVNHPIQGGLADIVKTAMVKIDEEMRPSEDRVRMLLQIHDELLFEIADGILQETARRIRELMEKAWPLEVPVQVDVKRGANWNDVEKMSW